MSRLFLQYYYDTTKFNILLCLSLFIIGKNFYELAITFGTFGSVVSFLVYRYFYEIQYYFYRNGGLKKQVLQLRVLVINLIVSIIILISLWSTT